MDKSNETKLYLVMSGHDDATFLALALLLWFDVHVTFEGWYQIRAANVLLGKVLDVFRLVPVEDEKVSAPLLKLRVVASEAAIEVQFPASIRKGYTRSLLV